MKLLLSFSGITSSSLKQKAVSVYLPVVFYCHTTHTQAMKERTFERYAKWYPKNSSFRRIAITVEVVRSSSFTERYRIFCLDDIYESSLFHKCQPECNTLDTFTFSHFIVNEEEGEIGWAAVKRDTLFANWTIYLLLMITLSIWESASECGDKRFDLFVNLVSVIHINYPFGVLPQNSIASVSLWLRGKNKSVNKRQSLPSRF